MPPAARVLETMDKRVFNFNQEGCMESYDVKMEDLPEFFQDIASIIGLDNAMKLVELAGGTSLYIPKYDSCILAAKSRRIYDEWKASTSGNPYAELAQKYNYSETHVRRIIREMHSARMPRREQLEMF